MSGGAARNPNSLANLRRQWQPGESGNPAGRKRGHHGPERKLRRLLEDGLEDEAEMLLRRAIWRLEPWAWDILWPTEWTYEDSKTGERLEPAWAALPPSPAWQRFANGLGRYAAERPNKVPAKLWAAIRR